MKYRILIVEDDPSFRPLVAEEISHPERDVITASSLKEAVSEVGRCRPDLILSDLCLPDGSGMDLFSVVKGVYPRPGFILFTAFGSIAEAVNALKAGVDNFLSKPVDLDHLRALIEKTLEVFELRRKLSAEYIEDKSAEGVAGLQPSKSAAMKSLHSRMHKVAQTDETVLILGESGSGKEVVARALHQMSNRAKGPFVSVNCAAIPESIAESEFFGHTRGSFTGADESYRGIFGASAGGTVFLDEIGELPSSMQSTLLRFLQDKRIRPVGSAKEYEVDVRIFTATNRNLQEAVKAGIFREDLFYRLETFTLKLPPLRERLEDLADLAAQFVREFAKEINKPAPQITEYAFNQLRQHAFPGNVRELRSLIKRAVLFAEAGRPMEVFDIQDSTDERAESVGQDPGTAKLADFIQELNGPLLPSLKQLNHAYINWLLKQFDGNKRRTAAVLGIGRRTLYDKL